MGRSAGVRPRCSLNNGKNRTGKWLDVQAKSLTNRLVPVLWACQPGVSKKRHLLEDWLGRALADPIRFGSLGMKLSPSVGVPAA